MIRSKETQIAQLRQKLALVLAQVDESNERGRTLLLKIAELEKQKTEYFELAEKYNQQLQQKSSECNAGRKQIEKLSSMINQKTNKKKGWF